MSFIQKILNWIEIHCVILSCLIRLLWMGRSYLAIQVFVNGLANRRVRGDPKIKTHHITSHIKTSWKKYIKPYRILLSGDYLLKASILHLKKASLVFNKVVAILLNHRKTFVFASNFLLGVIDTSTLVIFPNWFTYLDRTFQEEQHEINFKMKYFCQIGVNLSFSYQVFEGQMTHKMLKGVMQSIRVITFARK